jgi:hypothetical protein
MIIPSRHNRDPIAIKNITQEQPRLPTGTAKAPSAARFLLRSGGQAGEWPAVGLVANDVDAVPACALCLV